MIESKRWRDKRNGSIVTQFDIFDINFMEEVKDDRPNAWGLTSSEQKAADKRWGSVRKQQRMFRRR